MSKFRYILISLIAVGAFLLSTPETLGKPGNGKGKGKPAPSEKPIPPADDPAPAEGPAEGMEWIDSSGRPISVSHDFLGNAAVAYFVGAELRFARPGSTGWTVDSLGVQGISSHSNLALKFDANGMPGVVFDSTPSTGIPELRYGYFDGISWKFETIDIRGRYPKLAYDSNGTPHVAYERQLDYSHSILCVAKKVNGNWDIQNVDDSPKYYARGGILYPDIDIDHLDRIGVSYGYKTSSHQGRFAYHDGTSWAIQSFALGTAPTFSSVKFDSNSQPIIAYNDPNIATVVLARLGTDGIWDKQTVSSGLTDVIPVDVEMVLNSTGLPVISLRNYVDGEIWFMEQNGTGFSGTSAGNSYAKAMGYNRMQANTGLAMGNGVGLVFGTR